MSSSSVLPEVKIAPGGDAVGAFLREGAEGSASESQQNG
jgi:hypothetical protein